MIKDIERNNENISINDTAISILKEHFSSCFKKDGSFDMERFKEELKDKVDVVHEGYELKFLGKSYAKLLASLDTTTVITPNTDHNDLPENQNSENIYISGDNLDGLKHLLKSYSKSVKCIYIDPPYNTGSDGFVYKDNFNFTVDELQDKLSVDETQAKRILDLTKRNSASHSAWLMFMFSRLQLAKDLLKDDGVIFISIDDNEQANLKLLCDDIFGEENFVTEIAWRKSDNQANIGQIARVKEYIICYCKSKDQLNLNKIPLTEKAKKEYSYGDENGKFRRAILLDKTRGRHFYDVKTKSGNILNGPWMIKEDDFLEKDKNKEIYWTSAGDEQPYGKIYLDNSTGQIVNDFWDTSFGSNQEASLNLEKLFGVRVFDFSKSVKLLTNLLIIGTDKNDLVLDFFSGSASTAHAVMELNIKDKGNRKFISIQLPEVLNPKDSSQKTTYEFLKSINKPTTLDYVGIERIIRASKKIKTEEPNLFNDEGAIKGDFGFKHFILNEPNQNTLDKCETFDNAGLLGDASILDDFGTETVLTTWLNNDGYGLNANVETIDLDGYMAHYCKKHLYLINPDFTQGAMVALFEKYDTIAGFNPENIVLFGYSFIEWSVTEMLEKNLKILNDSEKNLKINIDVRY
ncbi:site-specific DNA-methyltransferase [Flavobacterium sp. XS2P12]|uniref:site-specific DNA-methyltransferase n=1 Tax=Flavobacterium melibiosi TaxID=3398734 RepID=UPI003A847024